MNLPNISIGTAIAALVGVLGIAVMIHYNVSPETLGLYAAAMIAVLAQFQKLFPGDPPPPAAGGAVGKAVLGAALMASVAVGCSPAMWKALDLAADKVKCAVANQHLPNDLIVEKCLRDTAPGDITRVLDIVAQARQETAAAVARQAEQDQRAGVSCSSDAGAPLDASTDAAH